MLYPMHPHFMHGYHSIGGIFGVFRTYTAQFCLIFNRPNFTLFPPFFSIFFAQFSALTKRHPSRLFHSHSSTHVSHLQLTTDADMCCYRPPVQSGGAGENDDKKYRKNIEKISKNVFEKRKQPQKIGRNLERKIAAHFQEQPSKSNFIYPFSVLTSNMV